MIENGLIMDQVSVAEEKGTLTLVEAKADQVKAIKLINMNEWKVNLDKNIQIQYAINI